MKKFNLFVLLLILVSSCTQQKDAVTGKIEGLTNDTIFVISANVNDMENSTDAFIDTIIAKGEMFTYNPPKADTSFYLFIPRQEMYIRKSGHPYIPNDAMITVLLTPGEKVDIQVSVDKKVAAYKGKGSQFNSSYGDAVAGWVELETENGRIEMYIDSLYSLPDVPVDLIRSQANKKSEIRNLINTKKNDYINSHPDNIVSAYLWSRLGGDVEDMLLKLSPEVKNSAIEPLIKRNLNRIATERTLNETEKNVVEGALAPDFTLQNVQGKDFTLSSLRGKPVVIDFWGAWCGFCVKGIPDMKKYYAKYKDKVEFVGVDCRDKMDAWKEALKKYEMPWIQVYNDKKWSESVSTRYGVRGYPTKFILDGEGKILVKVVGESPVFYQKMDSLFSK